jgi:hypothetical protein
LTISCTAIGMTLWFMIVPKSAYKLEERHAPQYRSHTLLQSAKR